MDSTDVWQCIAVHYPQHDFPDPCTICLDEGQYLPLDLAGKAARAAQYLFGIDGALPFVADSSFTGFLS